MGKPRGNALLKPVTIRLAFVATLIATALTAVFAQSAGTVVRNPKSGLKTLEVGDATGCPLVLLHGYGSSPQDWLPFTKSVVTTRRFVFPEGSNLTRPPDGPTGGRGWWRLGLDTYQTPAGIHDLSRARPAGLTSATTAVELLLQELHVRLKCQTAGVIVGGFSQGAMVAANLAFRTKVPIQALVLLSGTIVNEQAWLAGMRSRAGLPVFIAHGRKDPTLPFESSQRLESAMRAAGLRTTWLPFDDGHEIPAEVVSGLNRFLAEQSAPSR